MGIFNFFNKKTRNILSGGDSHSQRRQFSYLNNPSLP